MLGIGAMIGDLSGNKETIDALLPTLGKEISVVTLKEDVLGIAFSDDTVIRVWDNGQSCCELRYMRTDDDLAQYVGAKLEGMELRSAPNIPDERGEDHEVQFLVIRTTKGNITFSSHVEHNGYYGGFSIQIRNEET